jgi:hypothetical protein
MKTILVSRHHPLLVTLHWLTAVLIVALLGVGFFKLVVMLQITILHRLGGSVGMAG